MKKLFIGLQIFLLSFKIDPFSKSTILLELEPFSLKFGLIVFLNVLLSAMPFMFKFVKKLFLFFLVSQHSDYVGSCS